MAGFSKFNVVRQNIAAYKAESNNNQRMLNHRQMCWKCQKEKPLKGATMKFFGSVRMLICADCVTSKKAKDDSTT